MKTYLLIALLALGMPASRAGGQGFGTPQGQENLFNEGAGTKTSPAAVALNASANRSNLRNDQAYKLMDAERYRQAEILFEKTLAIAESSSGTRPQAHVGLAELNARQHLYPEAIRQYEMLLNKSSSLGSTEVDKVVHMRYALVLAQAGLWERRRSV